MSCRNYGTYYQGAMVTLDDFEPIKVIKYMCDEYKVGLEDKLISAIETDSLTGEQYTQINKMLAMRNEAFTLKELCQNLLDAFELEDVCCDDREIKLGNDMVAVSVLSEIEGDFIYDNEMKADEIIENCIMMYFYVPCVWNVSGSIVPKDKAHAAKCLKDAGKYFLKDDINWEERLGELYCSVFNS